MLREQRPGVLLSIARPYSYKTPFLRPGLSFPSQALSRHLEVRNIVTDPQGSGRRFLLFGVFNDGPRKGQGGIYQLDFDQLLAANNIATCNPGKDYETWNPSNDCMLGQKLTIFRRKADRLCLSASNWCVRCTVWGRAAGRRTLRVVAFAFESGSSSSRGRGCLALLLRRRLCAVLRYCEPHIYVPVPLKPTLPRVLTASLPLLCPNPVAPLRERKMTRLDTCQCRPHSDFECTYGWERSSLGDCLHQYDFAPSTNCPDRDATPTRLTVGNMCGEHGGGNNDNNNGNGNSGKGGESGEGRHRKREEGEGEGGLGGGAIFFIVLLVLSCATCGGLFAAKKAGITLPAQGSIDACGLRVVDIFNAIRAKLTGAPRPPRLSSCACLP